jgi:short-subunit dehydrogenase
VYQALEAFLPSMVENNHGHVIALSSMCGVIGLPNVVPYCASKFAVRGLMEALYEELRVGDTKNNKSEIKFTTVYPIMVNTGLVKKPRNRFPFLLDMQSPEKVANIIVKSMRRNYKEVSIPWMLMPLDRISRLLPGKFIQNVKDFIDTGLDPHTDD